MSIASRQNTTSLNQLKILGLIPARGGSKGIPHKNIVDLNGQPLIGYSINVALQSKHINKIVVTSDDPAILEVAKKYRAELVLRPPQFAGDRSPMDEAINHALEVLLEDNHYQPDLIVLLQPISPLRTSATIDQAVAEFIAGGQDYDSLMPLQLLEGKLGNIENNIYRPLFHELGKQRQELRPVYRECGTIFIFRPAIIKAGGLYGSRVYPFVIKNNQEAVDIDNYADLQLAAYHLKTK